MENEQHGPEKAESEVEIVIIEIVELEEHAKHHHDKPAPHAKHYAFRVDKERIVVDTRPSQERRFSPGSARPPRATSCTSTNMGISQS